jgi:hypothetical protein
LADTAASRPESKLKRLILGVLVFGTFSGLEAGPILWTVQNAVFTDGGTLTGSFTYDSVLDQILSYRLEVTGGSLTNFPAFVYQNGVAPNTSGSRLTAFIRSIETNGYFFETSLARPGRPFAQRELRLFTVPENLPANGGTVDLDRSLAVECFDCGLFRLFESGILLGTAVSDVPEPSTFALLALGGAVLYGFRAKRRQA